MTMRPRLVVLLICAFLPMSACDCENTVRGWVDGRDEPRKAAPDAGKAASSDPVEVEPNEKPDSATPIRITKELRAIQGTISDPSDVDWYALTADTEEPWVLDIAIEGGPDLIAEFDLSPSEEPPLRVDVQGPGEGESLQTVTVGKLPRKVGVRAKSAGPYTIRFTKRLSGGALEFEPNDVPELARPLQAPGEIQGFIERLNDRDVYAIRAAEDGVAKLEVLGVPGVNLIVRVFGEPSFAKPLASFPVAPGARAAIPNFALKAAAEDAPPAYYLVITSAAGHDREKAYRVRLVASPDAQAGLVELEPNDGVPMPLETPAVQFSGTLHAPDDVDRFAWGLWEDMLGPDAGMPDAAVDLGPDVGSPDASADAGADAAVDPAESYWAKLPDKVEPRPIAQLEVIPDVDWADFVVEWKDDGGTTNSQPATPGQGIKLCARTLPTDRFRFAVRASRFESPSEGSVAKYDVVLRQPPTANLENEPNDKQAQADRLAAGTERVGYLGTTDDVDVWGAVVIPPNFAEDKYATTRFEAKISAREHDIMAELRDEDGGVVAKVDRAGAGEGELVAVDLPKGLYYLHVRSKVGGSCEPYVVLTQP